VDKASLRQQFLERRLNITRSQYWFLTEDIVRQISLIDWLPYKTVHIFLPIRKSNEIDTFSVLNYFKINHPTIRIVVPRSNFKTLEMVNILFDHEHTILGRNRYDIPEPIYGHAVPAAEIDVVFIPLLVCDKKGNRVGYGKGFYDRFLAQCRADVIKIGLSFFDPVDEIGDVNRFDIPLDLLLTPGKTWTFDK
jgi:5-formyltetrahydrofolate cyclo-ligase